MKKLIVVIMIWIVTIMILFQIITIHNLAILENKMIQVETETYKMKTEIKEYQERTERLFDQNLKLITEGGWK